MLLYGLRHHVAGVAAAVLTLMPTPALAAQAWDQQKVTQIASALAEAVSGVYEEFRKQPPVDAALMQSRARYRLQDELRLLEGETRELARQLKSGEGLDATQPIYNRIGTLARDAREEGRTQLVAKPVQERVDHAEALWSQLTPYYTSASTRTGGEEFMKVASVARAGAPQWRAVRGVS
jgi:hypothetical protein